MEEVLLCIVVLGTILFIYGTAYCIKRVIEYKNEKEFEKRVEFEMNMHRKEIAYAAKYCEPLEFDMQKYKTFSFDKFKNIFILSDNQVIKENWKDLLGAKVIVNNNEIIMKIVHIEDRKIYAIVMNNICNGSCDTMIPNCIQDYIVPMTYSNNIIGNNPQIELFRGLTLGDIDETVTVKNEGKEITLKDRNNKPFQFFDKSLVGERVHKQRLNSLRNIVQLHPEYDPNNTTLIKLDSIIKYNSGKDLIIYLKGIKDFYRYKINDKPCEEKGYKYCAVYKDIKEVPKLKVICLDFDKM